ncbi:phosphate ABC transporter, inner membrane subunit PstA [Oleidesulfovibrio alaskensis G20]|jgi:phosphate transport system permease protein|uniref:Phosphate transport system permease protein PstA n=2 Tax=Oleidesulfovibrio alaskensis TaxID=58180 RepID=Q313N5_OLEA2|nr:phosphate ABC transporter, inner membrane subunit PstA [Oleidesulfovibrio alaskensis G20]MBG0774406.1 phosphate ABC transporter permease PstA [Oleidesulfovibrio alaskensis]
MTHAPTHPNANVFRGNTVQHAASTLVQDQKFLQRRKPFQTFMFMLFRASVVLNALALAVICGFVLFYGLPAVNWEFLTAHPRDAMTAGGIFPCILGTIALSYGSMLIALPWGVCTAIYLHEYARPGPFVHAMRLAINNLAGVPSVVFGLFGLAFFVTLMQMGVSLLAGMFTLAALILPLIIGASEEALRSVSQTYREASLALGATKWQTLAKVVLPAATPGILTGAILGIGRAAGETAAIMFTAAMFFSPKLPGSVFDSVMALPYHIYVLATAGIDIEKTRPLQYGTALVLIVLVLGMNLLAIIIRARLQRKLR